MQRLLCYCLFLLFLPSLAPAKIVFLSYRSVRTGGGLYVMDDDGNNLQRIGAYSAWWPVWSPDGQQIAFRKLLPVEPRQLQKSAVYIINNDGSNLHRLTDDTEENLKRIYSGNFQFLVESGTVRKPHHRRQFRIHLSPRWAYCFVFSRFLHTFRPAGAWDIGDNDFYKHSVPTGLKKVHKRVFYRHSVPTGLKTNKS